MKNSSFDFSCTILDMRNTALIVRHKMNDRLVTREFVIDKSISFIILNFKRCKFETNYVYFFYKIIQGSFCCTTLLLVSAASGKRSSFSGPHQPRVDVPILTASTKSEKSQDGKPDNNKSIPQSDRKSRYVTNSPFSAPFSESRALKPGSFLLSPPGTKMFRTIDAY